MDGTVHPRLLPWPKSFWIPTTEHLRWWSARCTFRFTTCGLYRSVVSNLFEAERATSLGTDYQANIMIHTSEITHLLKLYSIMLLYYLLMTYVNHPWFLIIIRKRLSVNPRGFISINVCKCLHFLTTFWENYNFPSLVSYLSNSPAGYICDMVIMSVTPDIDWYISPHYDVLTTT